MSDQSGGGPRGVDVVGPSEGQSIVFAHGAVFTRKMWAPQRRALSKKYQVVAPDLPGHGTRADETFRLEPAVQLLEEVIETHAGGNAVVVGLSLGGYVSTEYASRHPENVDGLVLSGSSVNPVDTMELLTRGIGGVTRLATRSDRIEGAVERFAERWVRKRNLPREVEAEIIDAGFYPKQFGNAGPYLAGRDFRAALASYSGPSLVLNGERDLVMRRGERAHVRAAQDGHLKVIEGVGHVCNLHRPEAYTRTLEDFTRQVVASNP